MQMNKKLNQKGFSLVEVIVSMLILSIVIVSILAAFTQSAKSNLKTKNIQGAEALVTNLVEYVEAGGSDFLEFVSGASDITLPEGDADGEQTFNLNNVPMGYNKYTIKVTKDNSPDKYDLSLNKYAIIKLGDSLRASLMVDVSDKGCDEDGDGRNDIDDRVLNMFYTFNLDAIEAANTQALLNDPTAEEIEKPANQEALENHVSREVIIETKKDGTTKMYIEVKLRYTLDSTVMIPAAESRVWEEPIFVSEKYANATSTDEGAVKLGSIYLAYEDSQIVKKAPDAKVRIVGENEVFGANVYIACQDSVSLDDSISKTITERMSGKQVTVDFSDGGILKKPASCHVYCSGTVSLRNTFAAADNVLSTSNSLVATDEQIRAIGYKFEVYGSDASYALAKGETVVLQR